MGGLGLVFGHSMRIKDQGSRINGAGGQLIKYPTKLSLMPLASRKIAVSSTRFTAEDWDAMVFVLFVVFSPLASGDAEEMMGRGSPVMLVSHSSIAVPCTAHTPHTSYTMRLQLGNTNF